MNLFVCTLPISPGFFSGVWGPDITIREIQIDTSQLLDTSMMAVQSMLLKSSVGVKVNCELREFAKSDGMPVYKMTRCTTRQFAGARIMAATKSGKGEGRPQKDPPPQDPKFTFWPFSSAGWFQMD